MSQITRRERWPSRFAYVVASASSVIGIGNFLRFPGIAAKHPGITFLIPYFILTWIVGYVIISFETATGEMYRSGIVTFFDRVYKRFRGFGILQMVSTLLTISYLNVILGWLFIYMIRSSYMPWTYDPQEYFQIYVLNQKRFRFDVLAVSILSASVVWIFLFMSIYKGVTHTTKIVYMTLPLSILMMFMLLLRSLTLEGSGTILYNFVTLIDWEALVRTRIWLEALGQVLFSLCIGIGSSCAYGSYRIKDGYLMRDCFSIVLLNLLIEMFGWIIIVCIGGYEGWSNTDIAENKFSLAFVLYPQLVLKLPFASSWSFLYYLFMLTFGINCSHASLESVVTTLLDSKRFSRYGRVRITAMVTLIGLLMSVVFCVFIRIIEPVDYFTSNFLLVMAGLGEILVAGYFYNKKLVSQQLGSTTVNIAYYSWLLAPLISSFLYYIVGDYVTCLVMGFSIFFMGSAFATFTTPSKLSAKKILNLLFTYQGKILIHHYNDTLRMSERTYFKLNMWWFIFIKFISTPLMICLLSVSIFHLPSYPLDYFIVGVLLCIMGTGIVIAPYYFPNAYSSFVPEDRVEEESKLHLDEWLRYWFRKERKILSGETPPNSRTVSVVGQNAF
eukprot:NODE_126_length_17250_cov_2.558743.p3 type:complete len:613 gc:universal NODE_126_length_17250_cov_2.558743:5986-7824(+)